MLFDSFNYWLFFGVVLVVLAALTDRASRVVLALASFVFYSFWNPWFVLLLAGSIAANFYFGLWIEHATTGRKKALVLALVFNLSLLGFFKYYGLLIGTAGAILHFNPHPLLLHIVLPVGISFFTFEGIAYAVDVYRRDTPAVRSLTDFAVFMSFFPHLVAGPIIRPANFFPQLVERPALTAEATKWGATQIIKGLFKKIVFADFFGPIANTYFAHTTDVGPVPPVIGVFAFALQIYFDFAGYTDIARGCARLLGYEFPPNFERPYLSANITEFWRRWHISLSTWLRDYLYIPLGGNRHGASRTYFNIVVVMVLGGLWHGASWNFALWGLYHGVLLLLHRLWTNRIKPPQLSTNRRGPGWILLRPPATALTFIVVMLGWIPFRATDLASTARIFSELSLEGVRPFLAASPAFVVLSGLPLVYCIIDPKRKLEAWLQFRSSLFTVGLITTVALILLQIFGQFGLQVPFIYFQF